jgi:hypothetical protein
MMKYAFILSAVLLLSCGASDVCTEDNKVFSSSEDLRLETDTTSFDYFLSKFNLLPAIQSKSTIFMGWHYFLS